MSDWLSNDHQIGVVSTFSELVNTPFQGKRNALCWQRHLVGNFKEIAERLPSTDAVRDVSLDELLALDLSEEGAMARDEIVRDLALLTDGGFLPSLNLIHHYNRDDEFDFIATDVYSFHVDRSPMATDTYLCTYFGASSDIIANEEVVQKIAVPEIRDQLKQLHQGREEEFEAFLKTYFFDLHYQPKVDATPVNLGLGHLWRLAIDHPTQKVLPCVHRAPKENEGEYRLMIIC